MLPAGDFYDILSLFIVHYSFFIIHCTLYIVNCSLLYAHTSQITSAPVTAATMVKGMPMRMKSRVLTL